MAKYFPGPLNTCVELRGQGFRIIWDLGESNHLTEDDDNGCRSKNDKFGEFPTLPSDSQKAPVIPPEFFFDANY